MIIALKLLVGHVLGDFVFQTDKISRMKLEKFQYLILHISLVYLSMLFTTLDFLSPKLLVCIGIISCVHAIDYLKKYFLSATWWFFVDQAIHIMSIVLVLSFFGYVNAESILSALGMFYKNVHIWIYISGYLLGIFAGNIVVRVLLSDFINGSTDIKTSAAIGIVERFIVITLALLNQYTAIGIIFAIKGAARKVYIEANDKQGEYYFLGTAMSFSIAIMAALGINILNSFI